MSAADLFVEIVRRRGWRNARIVELAQHVVDKGEINWDLVDNKVRDELIDTENKECGR
jgi:hypothetical protein